jgi:hypothetical protein
MFNYITSICWIELYSYFISRVNMNQLAKEIKQDI